MLLGHTYLLFCKKIGYPDYMSFPVLSCPYECAISTDLTVRYHPVKVCDINRSHCAICSGLCTYKHILKSSAEGGMQNDELSAQAKTRSSLTAQQKQQIFQNFTGYDISPDMV